MTMCDLLYAIGEADECFVDEAGETDADMHGELVGRRRRIIRWVGVAAMMLVAVGATYYIGSEKVLRKDSDKQESCQYLSQEAIVEENMMEFASESAGEGAENDAIKETAEGADINTFDIFMPSDEERLQMAQRIKTVMISSFERSNDAVSEEMDYVSGDMAVENGGVFLSRDLSEAIEYYGGQEEYRYRVFVELFQDGVQIANDGDVAKKEVERLAGLGYVVAMENYSDGKVAKTYFTLHATAGQVKNFDADASIGYALWLYDEKVVGSADLNGTVHVWFGGQNAGKESDSEGGGE